MKIRLPLALLLSLISCTTALCAGGGKAVGFLELGYDVYAHAIDQKPAQSSEGVSGIPLRAGEHSVEVGYSETLGTLRRYSQGTETLTVDVAPGHIYEITATEQYAIRVSFSCEDITNTKIPDVAWGAGAEHVEALIKANPNLVNGQDSRGRTPLDDAALKGSLEVAQFLVARGARVNIKDNDGWTPLHYAVRDNANIVALLLAHGADASARDKDGWTPLHYAGNKDVTALLIGKGADVNHRDDDGNTPLHSASNREVAESLIAAGADVNARGEEGWTPLHRAARSHQDVAQALLEHGANVNAKTDDGWTPLHVAAEKGFKDMVALFLTYHPEVNARNSDGVTPLGLARRKGHEDVVALLRQYGGHE